jgi:regulatory protein YycH of two-component signal transduction system YycFG
MIEKLKTVILSVLIVLSLLQSYWLAYSMPGLAARVRTGIDYVNTEQMGPPEQIENVIFPESIVLHMGQSEHTVLYPPTNFYDLVYRKIQAVGFKSITRYPRVGYDWNQIRDKKKGVELRFDGVPVSLLGKQMKLEGDLVFMADRIDRIWIYMDEDTELVHAFLFSSDGRTVYEASRTDVTARDVEEYIGFGQYGTSYKPDGDIYLPEISIEAVEAVVNYKTYTPEQMQRSLFFDPGTTRTLENLNGALIFTDGKRGLQIEQNGKWASYTNPAAPQTTQNDTTENVLASLQFINEHGGWDGLHRYVPVISSTDAGTAGEDGRTVLFQQYYGAYPIISDELYKFGYMRLLLQQGIVTEYERSLMTLDSAAKMKTTRWLPGGEILRSTLRAMDRRSEIRSVYPAVRVNPSLGGQSLSLEPVWAARYEDGTQRIVMSALPVGYDGAGERHQWQLEQQQKKNKTASTDKGSSGIGISDGGGRSNKSIGELSALEKETAAMELD